MFVFWVDLGSKLHFTAKNIEKEQTRRECDWRVTNADRNIYQFIWTSVHVMEDGGVNCLPHSPVEERNYSLLMTPTDAVKPQSFNYRIQQLIGQSPPRSKAPENTHFG